MSGAPKGRYICDALYGIIYFPEFVWEVIPTIELQRLREVRLCNINSFCLTGGANINRYEHAIGTCYLALECLKSWPALNPITEDERRQLAIAALLHDTLNAPLGHSIQYTESKDGYEPEKHFKGAITEGHAEQYYYRQAQLEPIFFGMNGNLIEKISKNDFLPINNIISGKGRLGPLINGTIDLDNIDNVYRFAYHLGIVRSGKNALELAKSLFIESGKLTVKQNAVPLLREWFDVRRKLYSFLLLNPEEFSAKCMLEEAFQFAKSQRVTYSWHDTDYAFLTELNKLPSAREIVREFLFSINNDLSKSITKQALNDDISEAFKRKDYCLSPKVKIEDIDNGWKLTDKTKEYLIENVGDAFNVFKLVPRPFEISTTVRRLMAGDLYGCIGIFSSSKIEERSRFKDVMTKRAIENRASEIVRALKGRFGTATVIFHLIEDINKTQRKIDIRTDQGNIIEIGKPLNRLLIGAFFRNQQLSMYSLPNSDEMGKIRSHIHKYLSSILTDQGLTAISLYEEAVMYTE
ncbi:MAG: HD domain-containing protein [Nitrososphaerota archaeon]|nr:HD domain-containing protein [Nitrososphaerota archaeon]